jgi:hypothetical protein
MTCRLAGCRRWRPRAPPRPGRTHCRLRDERLAADDAGHVEPLDRAHGDEHQHEVAPEEHDQQDHEEDEGQRVEHVDDAHHHRCRCARRDSRPSPRRHADHEGDRRRKHADGEGDPPGDERAGEQVAAVAVGAEEEMPAVDRNIDVISRRVLRGDLADPGGAEQVGAVEIDQQPLVDLPLPDQGLTAIVVPSPTSMSRRSTRARMRAAMRSDGRRQLLGRGIGVEARRDADVFLVDLVVVVRHHVGAEGSSRQGDQRQHDGARHRGAVAQQPAPGVLPERAAPVHGRQQGGRSVSMVAMPPSLSRSARAGRASA